MTGQPGLGWGLAIAMLVVSVYCAGRLAAAGLALGRVEADADLTHVAMGVAMSGMLVPRLNPAPVIVWQVCFAVVAGWFGWRALASPGAGLSAGAGHSAQHAMHGAAMVYMLTATRRLAVTAPLALLLAVGLLGYAVWETDRLSDPPPAPGLLAPRLAGLCRIAIGVTMGYMLILLL